MRASALLIVAGVLLAGPASAQIDPNPDGVGMYVDLEATTTDITAQIGVPVDVYLMLTRASTSHIVVGWECSIETPPNAFAYGWTLPPDNEGGIFVIDPPDFQAGLPPGNFVPGDIHMLMKFVVGVTNDEPAEFYVRAHSQDSGGFGLPVYVNFDADLTMNAMHPWPGGEDEPALILNARGTPVEPSTWGAVKAIYR